ncbi:hypothetical protein ACSSJ7_17955, partial [Escherichia coli]
MKKMQSIVLALSLVLVAPMAAQAAEITLVPSVKLQIGDRDNRGNDSNLLIVFYVQIMPDDFVM